MKNHILPFTLMLLCCIIAACGHNNTEELNAQALAYLDAISNYRFDDAKPYATNETCEKTLQYYIEWIMPHTDPESLVGCTPATITIDNTEITSDSTAVVAFTQNAPNGTSTGTLNMLNRDGKWLANDLIEIPDIFYEIDTAAFRQAMQGVTAQPKSELRSQQQ